MEGDKNPDWNQKVEENAIDPVITDEREEREKTYKKMTKDKLIETIEDHRKVAQVLKDENNRLVRAEDRLMDTVNGIRKELVDEKRKNVDLSGELDKTSHDKYVLTEKCDNLNDKLREELVNKKKQIEELIIMKSKLQKKEVVVRDLMGRLETKGAGNDTNCGETGTKPRVLYICEKTMTGIANQVDNKGAVCDRFTGVDSLTGLLSTMDREEHRQKIFSYDRVVMLLGTNDIKEGTNGYSLFTTLTMVVKQLRELDVEIAIIQLPPPLDAKYITDVAIYNMKLQDLSETSLIVDIEECFNMILTSKVYRKDGKTLEPESITLIVKEINKQLPAPTKRNKEPLKVEADRKPLKDVSNFQNSQQKDETNKEVMPIDPLKSGLIIGTGGCNIRAMQAKSGTHIKIIDYEKNGKPTKGALITGSAENIQVAKSLIIDLIESESATFNKRGNESKYFSNGSPVLKKKK
jgi:hypothetical protein